MNGCPGRTPHTPGPLIRGSCGDAGVSTPGSESDDCGRALEAVAANWKRTLLQYQEHAIVPPDADLITLPAEIDMIEHPDYVHVAAGTIREKVRRMVAARRRRE